MRETTISCFLTSKKSGFLEISNIPKSRGFLLFFHLPFGGETKYFCNIKKGKKP